MLTSDYRDKASRSRFRFGEFILDLERGALSRGGVEVSLRPKSFQVLSYLVGRSGRLVTKDELLESIWGHRYVTEGSLGQCIMDIRRALGDEGHEAIRTVPRRGYIFELPVQAGEGEGGAGRAAVSPGASGRSLATRAFAWGSVAIAAVATAWLLLVSDPFRGKPAPIRGGNSIVVLPFLDLSPEADQTYFADGLTEELINALTRLPGLQVIARTSSFAFKGSEADIPEIAQRLGVTHVLEGSVRKAGDRVRITAQLIDAGANAHIWSKTFDREFDDIFAIQTDIGESVADSLQVALPRPGGDVYVGSYDPGAYEHYLQGRFFWRRQGPGDIERAESHYRRAVVVDPGLADAWAGLASILETRIREGNRDGTEKTAELRVLLERAITLDPGHAEAHARLARYYFVQGDRERADRHWEQALDLGENVAVVQAMAAGWAVWRGRIDEAIEFGRKAVAADPLAANFRGNLAHALLGAGRYEEAERELRQVMALSPRLGRANSLVTRTTQDDLALVQIMRGRAREAVTQLASRPPGLNRDQNLAIALLALGRAEQAEAAIERVRQTGGLEAELRLAEIEAYRGNGAEAFRRLGDITAEINAATRGENDEMVPYIQVSALLAPLRDDPRWAALWEPWRKLGRM